MIRWLHYDGYLWYAGRKVKVIYDTLVALWRLFMIRWLHYDGYLWYAGCIKTVIYDTLVALWRLF